MNTDLTPTVLRLERLLCVLQKALGHELPNTLVAVQGLARLLELEEGERLGSDGRAYLGRLAAGAGRAHALVNALADVARLARPAPPATAVDFAEVAAEALAEANQLAPSRPAEYHHLKSGLVVFAPRAALHKALVLLTRWGGAAATRVDVTAHAAGGAAEIRVAHQGAPLAPEKIDRLFEPFTGADDAGLELFLARQLAEDWGGAVRAESAGGGTVFVVTCPMSAACSP
jgi:signal transduction histidine kinase